MSVIHKEPSAVSPENLCCLPEIGREPNSPLILPVPTRSAPGACLQGTVWERAERVSTPALLCKHRAEQLWQKQWVGDDQEGEPVLLECQVSANRLRLLPTHPRRGTAQLSPLPPPKTSDGTEGGSGKERTWKEEEGQKNRGRESLSILRTHRIHHFLFQSLPGVLVSTRYVCMYVCIGGRGVEGKILFSCVQMCSKSTIIFFF